MENNTKKQVQEVEFNYPDLTVHDLVAAISKQGKVSLEEGKKFVSLWDSLLDKKQIQEEITPRLIYLGLTTVEKGIDPIYSMFCYNYLIGFIAGIEYGKNKYK